MQLHYITNFIGNLSGSSQAALGIGFGATGLTVAALIARWQRQLDHDAYPAQQIPDRVVAEAVSPTIMAPPTPSLKPVAEVVGDVEIADTDSKENVLGDDSSLIEQEDAAEQVAKQQKDDRVRANIRAEMVQGEENFSNILQGLSSTIPEFLGAPAVSALIIEMSRAAAEANKQPDNEEIIKKFFSSYCALHNDRKPFRTAWREQVGDQALTDDSLLNLVSQDSFASYCQGMARLVDLYKGLVEAGFFTAVAAGFKEKSEGMGTASSVVALIKQGNMGTKWQRELINKWIIDPADIARRPLTQLTHWKLKLQRLAKHSPEEYKAGFEAVATMIDGLLK